MERLRRLRRSDAEVLAQLRAQRLVDEQRLGAVAFAVERLHEDPVAGLAIRLELDELSSHADRRRQLRAANAERRGGVGLERAQLELTEATTFFVDPGCLLPREKRPPAHEHRDL